MAQLDDHGYNPSSPAGQIESAGSFASGLTHLSGWRRQVARWLVVFMLMTPLIGFSLDHLVR
jgi:hypothetical protein